MARVLMVASEAAPFVKTGGLADVLGSLPAALVARGDEIGVVVPRYRAARIPHCERVWNVMHLGVGPQRFEVAIDLVVREGVRYFFVDCPPLFDRPGIYNENLIDYSDNHLRFALLSQAAIGVARHLFKTDVFHSHDWQAGFVPYYLRTMFGGDPTFFGTQCAITIHNLGYQGNFPQSTLYDLGVDRGHFHMEGAEFKGQVSMLKAGIVWADAVTTVSPTYAREIQTPEYGFGFDGLLRSRNYKLTGILNGVDYNEWSPEADPLIPAHYSPQDLRGKETCKLSLLAEMGLPGNGTRPCIGIVSRFADQKGFDLVAEVAADLAEEDVSVVVLGSGEHRFEEMFRTFARVRPDKFGVRIGYDNGLAHRIEAGSDIFLMPSRYEPCGLNQMYSLRYGTVPVVRGTGGLEDTVDSETGFKFYAYDPDALRGALGSALLAYRDRPGWMSRMRKGMAKDYSWHESAKTYQQLYRVL